MTHGPYEPPIGPRSNQNSTRSRRSSASENGRKWRAGSREGRGMRGLVIERSQTLPMWARRGSITGAVAGFEQYLADKGSAKRMYEGVR